MPPWCDKTPSGTTSLIVYGFVAANVVVFLTEFSLPREALLDLAATFGVVAAFFVPVMWLLLQFLPGVASLGLEVAHGGVAYWVHVGGFPVAMVLINFWPARDIPLRKPNGKPQKTYVRHLGRTGAGGLGAISTRRSNLAWATMETASFAARAWWRG